MTEREHNPVVLAPILGVEDAAVIGFVYLELRSLAQPWTGERYPACSGGPFPGSQVASTLYQAQVYRDTLDFQVALQELEFASGSRPALRMRCPSCPDGAGGNAPAGA